MEEGVVESFFGRGVFADNIEGEFVVTVTAIEGASGWSADEVDFLDEVLAVDAEVDGSFAVGFPTSDGVVMELDFHDFRRFVKKL